MSVLEFRNVSKSFPGVKALGDISFAVEKQEVHVLIGENGAGKSTLIKILTGVNSADPGSEIWIDNKKAEIGSPVDALNLGIVAIYQDFSLFDNLSVVENIALGLQVTRQKKVVDWKGMRKKAEQAMKKVRLEADPDELVANISVAKKQLVAIARALVYDVKVLIMDEPTSCLSQGEVEQLFEIVRELKADGVTIIFVSHKMEEIFEIGDQITVLRDGQYIKTASKDNITIDELIELMVGRKVTYETYGKRKMNEPVLRVENLCKKANFKDISFELNKGEILGVTGLVGAGRTEMVQAIFGLNKPDSGAIYLHGKKITIHSPVDAIKHKFGYVPENRLTEGLVQTQSIKRNLNVAILEKLKKGVFLSDTARSKSAANWMEKLSIKPVLPDMPVGKLSGGNQQRVVIAKWLATDPEVLIVDEPTAGIDIGAKEEIHRLLRELSDGGMSIIVVSSELPEVISICDRILIMKNGRIVAEMGEGATQEEILNKAVL
ncbi:sugar ABC transporter ATP-binding protein [Christensenella intestinihominis]|uniref:sugar ABC transporter ATP-binding protein n=1 Tax=Christensenella intestinihominis TaxID=1851429 RepID=UPI00082DF847|nr:sugar ABC transporter ATP-binding protein [Christensenella intestinihominis]